MSKPFQVTFPFRIANLMNYGQKCSFCNIHLKTMEFSTVGK